MRRQSFRDRAIGAAKRHLPAAVRQQVVRAQRVLRLQWPPTGTARFGSLRRLTPISPIFGLDRGLPIDRYYIEAFLDRHRTDIRGRAREFGGTEYLDRFGDDRVRQKDVFSYVPGPGATLVMYADAGLNTELRRLFFTRVRRRHGIGDRGRGIAFGEYRDKPYCGKVEWVKH